MTPGEKLARDAAEYVLSRTPAVAARCAVEVAEAAALGWDSVAEAWEQFGAEWEALAELAQLTLRR
jgi:hypothetical protein